MLIKIGFSKHCYASTFFDELILFNKRVCDEYLFLFRTWRRSAAALACSRLSNNGASESGKLDLAKKKTSGDWGWRVSLAPTI